MRTNVFAAVMVLAASIAASCGNEPNSPPPETAKAAAPASSATSPELPKAPPPAPSTPAAPAVEPPSASAPDGPVAPVAPPPVTKEPVPPRPAATPVAPPQSPLPPAPPTPAVPAPRPRAEPPVATPPVIPAAPSAPMSADAFVGAKACQKCHFTEHKSWKKTPLARSLDALKPTTQDDIVRYDAKRRAGLDPARDYTTDATCLACHTTGYGGTNGYPANPDVTGCIACEACHGPAERYVKHKIAGIDANKDARFPRDELTPLGLVVPDAAVCARCHNERNPTHADDHFDFDVAKTKVHEHPKK